MVRNVKFDPTNCVRIAVLHHHPLEEDASNSDDRLKGMDNNDGFIRACFESGINLVLFGHKHKAYQRTLPNTSGEDTPFGRPGPLHFLCCPTTFEYTAREPGFYVHEIYTDRAEVNQYYWRGAGFSLRPKRFVYDFT
jgi:hypothetical protein